MKLTIIEPEKELQSIVRQYVIIESLHQYESLWVLPNAGNFIIFNRGTKGTVEKYESSEKSFSMPMEFYVGMKRDDVLKFELNKKILDDRLTFPIIAVELLPLGFNSLFSSNAAELRENYILLDECLKGKDLDFNELYNCDTSSEQISYIEKRLLRLKNNISLMDRVHNVIEEIIFYILQTLHSVNVSDILEKFGYSRTSLERDFKKLVGYTPKEFIQIMRFCHIFKDLMYNGYDFMKLEYDFFDQSHMNKAFKKFTDILPSKLQTYVLDNHVLVYQLCERNE